MFTAFAIVVPFTNAPITGGVPCVNPNWGPCGNMVGETQMS